MSVTVNSSSFVDNASELQGGVFLLNGGITSINGSSFIDNVAERAWGGVFHAWNRQAGGIQQHFQRQ